MITFNPLWPVFWIALLGLAAAGATVWAYAGLWGHWATRRLFLPLRCLALLVALLCLLRPSIRTVKVYAEKARAVLLLDGSESMSVCDGAGGQSRSAEMNQMLRRGQSRVDALSAQFELSVLRFGSDVRPARLGAVAASDPRTALGDALRAALAEGQGKRLAAVVVVSDGASNAGAPTETAARLCRQQRVPVVAIGLGKPTESVAARDVRVKSINCPRAISVRNVLTVRAGLLLLGCDRETVEVKLLFGDKAVAAKRLDVTGDRVSTTVELQYTPAQCGTFKIEVAAAPLEHEIVVGNNELASFVRVQPGGLRVLYLEGAPRPEYKFLKRCFESAAGMGIAPRLIFFFQGRPAGGQMPQRKQDWEHYDLILLGDLPSAAFTAAQLQAIANAVTDKGVGLIMIGGVRNFGAGGYRDTPLSRILPVAMSPQDGQSDAEFRLTPTAAGYEHYALRLDPDPLKSREAWAKLPLLKGRVKFGAPAPAATVLATDGHGAPVLVAQRVGKGRAIAFAADTTWRWAMAEANHAAQFKRFWRQLALWVTGREDKGGDLVFLRLDRARYPKGEKVPIRAEVQDKNSAPISDADVTATVHPPTGAPVPLAMRFQDDHYRAVYFATEPGDYKITLEAERGGKRIGKDAGQFLVYERNWELDEPEADLAALRNLAKATQGAYFPSDQLDKALDFLAGLKSETKVKKSESRDIWDNALMFYLFLMLLCVEWILRKVQGLV